MKKQIIIQRKKDIDEAHNVSISGYTKQKQGQAYNRERMSVDADNHAGFQSGLEKICPWKQIMNNPKNNYLTKYECKDCNGYDLTCSANPYKEYS